MSTAKSIAGMVPGLQAVSLVGYNIGELDFDVKPRKGRKKRNHVKKIVRMGVTNLVAIPLIGTTSGMVNQIP